MCTISGDGEGGVYITFTDTASRRQSSTTRSHNHHGLKKFKQKSEKAVMSELEQLHRSNAFWPMRPEDLSEEKKHESLALLIFLKE